MKGDISMVRAFTTLLLFQLAGEILVRILGVPLPGPVVGMLLLLALLLARGNVDPALGNTARTILAHLAMLFVPAGVGVMVHIALIRSEWLPILITLVVSTYLTMLVTALTMQALRRLVRS
jgi:holin-like protein